MAYATKAQLAAVKKELNERITSLAVRTLASETKIGGLEKRIADLEVPPVELPPPPPPTPAPSTFAPDIFHGDTLIKFPQRSGGAIYQPSEAISPAYAPDGSGDRTWKLSVSNTTGTNITSSPRAEMISVSIPPAQIAAGFWWGLAWWMPTTFPASIPGWWNLAEFYGEPFAGSPTIEIDLRRDGVGWHTNSEGGNKDIWRTPYTRGKKETALMHIEPNRVEVWHNGDQVASVAMKTIGAANATGPQHCYIQSYRQKDMFTQSIDLYHWPLAIGTRRELVEYV